MSKTAWTDRRLQRLFDGWNKRFWKGKLPRYSVVATTLYKGGLCHDEARTIFINIESQESDRSVRSTLLHEMAHAACSSPGHGKEWLGEMERLKGEGAPLLRSEFLYGDSRHTVDVEAIVGSFEDWAWEGVSWKDALGALGWEHGWIDAKGNPVSDDYARLIDEARRAYHRARRQYLQHQKVRREYESRKAEKAARDTENSS